MDNSTQIHRDAYPCKQVQARRKGAKVFRAFLRLSFVGLALACSLAQRLLPPTPEIISECFLNVKAQVWADLDADGERDADDPALRGVVVTVSRKGSSGANRFEGQSAADGSVEIHGIGNDCEQGDFAATVIPPEGYTASTPARIDLATVARSDVLQFGLAPVAEG